MSDELMYECPHCHATVRVASALTGEQVDCPDCDGQFQVQAPTAIPVDAARGRVSETAPTIEQQAEDERILRHVHPVVFRNHLWLTSAGLLLCIAGAAALILGLVGGGFQGLEGTTLIVPGGVLLVAALAYFGFRWLQAMSLSLKITTERTIAERGILSKSTNEVQHDDVRNIKSDRNVLERLLNYGDLALSSSGQDDMEIVVHDVPDPEGIIRIIRNHQ